MKTIKTIFTAMAAVASMLSFTSCGSDDNDAPKVPAAKSIAGTYKGNMSCSVMGQASDYADMTFTVTATSDTNVSIQLPAFGEAPMALPSITAEGLEVTEADGVYTIKQKEIQGTLSNGKEYTLIIAGSCQNSALTLNYNLQYGKMPMPMICSVTAAPKEK